MGGQPDRHEGQLEAAALHLPEGGPEVAERLEVREEPLPCDLPLRRQEEVLLLAAVVLAAHRPDPRRSWPTGCVPRSGLASRRAPPTASLSWIELAA